MQPGERVFVDTGVWIALALTRDPLHERALEAWRAVGEVGAHLYTSVPIVIETFTFLERNARRDVALAWKDSLSELRSFEILACTPDDLEEAWPYFQRQDLHKLSAADATSFAIMLLPQAAGAGCSGKCQHIEGQPLFCRECVDAEHETGVLCQQSGPCGCFFVQCASFQSTLTLSEDSDTPPLLAAAEPQSACKYWEVVLEDQSLPTPLIDDSQPAPVQETDEPAPASEEATS